MEFASVYHRTIDNYCYMLDENQLIINLIFAVPSKLSIYPLIFEFSLKILDFFSL